MTLESLAVALEPPSHPPRDHPRPRPYHPPPPRTVPRPNRPPINDRR